MFTNVRISNHKRRKQSLKSSHLDRITVLFDKNIIHILIIWAFVLHPCFLLVNGANPNDEFYRNDHLQRFSLHATADCSDPGEFYTENVRNLKQVSLLVDRKAMKCFCNWHGMWIFTSRTNYKRTVYKEKSGQSTMRNPGKACESRKINWNFLQLNSIRHIGNPNDSMSGLSLYREPEYFGKELYLSPSSSILTSLSLPSSKIFRSYGLTGRRRWTLFMNTNFTGNSTCIVPWPKKQADNEIKVEPKGFFVVGSIRNGCNNSYLNRKRTFADQPEVLTLYAELPESNDTKLMPSEVKLAFDGQDLRLPMSREFQHFSIIGQVSWTIYSGTEFNGKCQCLFPLGGIITDQQPRRSFDSGVPSTSSSFFSPTERARTPKGMGMTTNYGRSTAIIPTVPPDLDGQSSTTNTGRIIGSIKKGCVPCSKSYLSAILLDDDEENVVQDDDDDYYDADVPINQIKQFAPGEIDKVNLTENGGGRIEKDANDTDSSSAFIVKPCCCCALDDYLGLLNFLNVPVPVSYLLTVLIFIMIL